MILSSPSPILYITLLGNEESPTEPFLLFLRQLRKLLSFCSKAHCWLMFTLLLTSFPRVFSVKLLFCQSAPRAYLYFSLFFPGCRSLHFSQFNFERFPSSISSHCQSCYEWQKNNLVYQSLFSVLYCLQPCWGYSFVPRPLVKAIKQDVKQYWHKFWPVGHCCESEWPPVLLITILWAWLPVSFQSTWFSFI